MTLTRRHVVTGASALGVVLGIGRPGFAQTRARVVVVGGGFAGATAARALAHLMPNSLVTLVEPNSTYTACPFSNLVIGGERNLSAQQFGYEGVRGSGATVVKAKADAVNSDMRTVRLSDGTVLPYDRLILAPGIDLRWGALEGYDEAAVSRMPHAWKAGTQTLLLRQQLEVMPDGGLVVMSAPAAPYRCPPGPYERASLIAHYLKTRKPRSKLIILDAKDSFSKMPLFQAAWAEKYADVLEWRGAFEDGRVARVDAASMTVETDFETLKADVANIIPPQQAGAIAAQAGVANETGWCPIDATTFESTLQAGIHVIGDAAIANPMPKSAFAANLQAKVCAVQVARMLAGLEPASTKLANTCYSFVSPDQAVSIVGVYSNEGGVFSSIEGAGGLSPAEPMPGEREREARAAKDWFRTIGDEAFR